MGEHIRIQPFREAAEVAFKQASDAFKKADKIDNKDGLMSNVIKDGRSLAYKQLADTFQQMAKLAEQQSMHTL